MPTEPGLRERKKARTHRAISEAAIALFLQRGYDAVSVSEIAAAAEVSKRTLFSYFPTKDELVLHRFADHQDEAARVVRGRPSDMTPLDALRDHIRSALGRQDPITGLCDHPAVVAFYRLVSDTPALGAATARYLAAGEDALTAALHESAPDTSELAARLAAGQILFALRTLGHANQVRIAAGATADELAPVATAEAELAFDQLSSGLARYR
jgi:AcrR family transcriptional regulator